MELILTTARHLKGIIKGAGYNRTDYHVLVEEQSKEMNQ